MNRSGLLGKCVKHYSTETNRFGLLKKGNDCNIQKRLERRDVHEAST